jgi:prepilin-type N-terminal cleavage/methylation domain-containing protein
MKTFLPSRQKGFSLVELLVAMTITLVLLGLVSTLFARAMGTRSRESRKTDALTSARAALSIISREIGNSGYGLSNNGIVPADSSAQRIHIRANLTNDDYSTDDPGEDVTYFYDAATQSIVRHSPAESPATAVVVNRISNVTFTYFDYVGSSSTPTTSATPSLDTGRIRITVTVALDPVQGQPNPESVTFTSDVTLRNSTYMLNQY